MLVVVDVQWKPIISASITVLSICLQQTSSTPCACGSLCMHREPHAQGVLDVCCKQMLKTVMDALIMGFHCTSTTTSINSINKNGTVCLAFLPCPVVNTQNAYFCGLWNGNGS